MSLDTRGLDPQRLLPQSLEDRLLGWLSWVGGGVLMLVVGLLWATLQSWSVTDPSLTNATNAAPQNWLGPIGAVISDLLLQTLGLAAVVGLVAPLVWAAQLMTERRLISGRSKFGYYPLSMLAVAGAMSALPALGQWPMHHGFGGVLGDGLFNLIAGVFGLLNEQRAGLAAGLVLWGAAAATFMRSLTADSNHVWATLVAMATGSEAPTMSYEHHDGDAGADAGRDDAAVLYDDHSVEPSLSMPLSWHHARGDEDVAQSASDGWQETRNGVSRLSGWLFTSRKSAQASQRWSENAASPQLETPRGPYGAASELAVPAAPRVPSILTPPQIPIHSDQPGLMPPKLRPLEDLDPRMWPSPAAVAPRVHAPNVAISPDGLAPLGGLSAASDSAAQDQSTVQADDFRGLGFDVSTDASSRAIAARFAPKSATTAPLATNPARPSGIDDTAQRGVRSPATSTRHGPGSGARVMATVGNPVPDANGWQRPPLDLIHKRPSAKVAADFSDTVLRGNARLLEDVLKDFGVQGEVKNIRPGPVVTSYELEPARGTKSSRVIGLADDIARSMSVTSVRAAVVPGQNAIGLELPNARREGVGLRDMFDHDSFQRSQAALPLALGKSISGDPVVADLASMPHLLVAGTTGSGKSVGVNAMIMSLLYRFSPDQCRLLMIDPKMLELSVYNGIPHLLTPVVVDPAKAVVALNWAVSEMEERYKRMAALNVRNIDVFNNRVAKAKARGEVLKRSVQTGFDGEGRPVFENQSIDLQTMARIVIVVDEFADLMMVAGKDVEAAVQRLAQMARASGIHLIMATQRPSVDVITGTIKANFPTRISFKVTSKVDSRTILNEQGAEQLLGQGDMLFSTGAGQLIRVHGAFISDEDVEAVTDWLRRQGQPSYVPNIVDPPPSGVAESGGGREPGNDDLFDRAVAIVMRDRKASTSYLQRRLSIGYNRAADLIERMERDGMISAANNVGKREILMTDNGDVDAA